MTFVMRIEQVLNAVQQVKAGATGFCTNFFPAQTRLEDWINRGELRCEVLSGTAFFLRRDRDFEHLYFSAADPARLQEDLSRVQELKSSRVTADLIGSEDSLKPVLDAFSSAGFRPYSRLLRLCRASSPSIPDATSPRTSSTSPRARCPWVPRTVIWTSHRRFSARNTAATSPFSRSARNRARHLAKPGVCHQERTRNRGFALFRNARTDVGCPLLVGG